MAEITEKAILAAAKVKTIADVAALNLANLSIPTFPKAALSCFNLRFANLSSNRIVQISLINQLPQLRKLDLSNNSIGVLPDEHFFESMRQLRILYLHQNNVQKLSAAKGLVRRLFPIVNFKGRLR